MGHVCMVFGNKFLQRRIDRQCHRLVFAPASVIYEESHERVRRPTARRGERNIRNKAPSWELPRPRDCSILESITGLGDGDRYPVRRVME
jgi:hypothetical protein